MKNTDQKIKNRTLQENVKHSEAEKNWFKKKYDYFLVMFKSLLTQGLTPRQIAAAFALGFAAGTFPILGTHTFLAIFFAFIFRLNQLAVYLGTWISAPVYFLLLLPSLRTGEYIFSADSMNLDFFLDNLKRMINSTEDFLDVWIGYSQSILHIIIGWIPLTIGICLAVYIVTYYLAAFFLKNRSKFFKS